MESNNRVMNIPLDIDQIKTIMDLLIDRIREVNNDMKHLFEEDRVFVEKELNELQDIWEHLRRKYNPSL